MLRQTLLPEAGPKRKLFDAAEQLFADHGFEAVSVRDITQLAKANLAAVNYHFGSREGLLVLVMTHCMAPINEERLARLELLEKRGTGKAVPPLEEIIEAFVRPLVGQLRKSELPEERFYKLLGRIFAWQGDGLPAVIEDPLRQTSDRFMRAFEKALPLLSAADLTLRIHFMIGGMIHMLTHREPLLQPSGGTAGVATMEAMLSRFVRFAAVGLREGVEIERLEVDGSQSLFDF